MQRNCLESYRDHKASSKLNCGQ